MLKDDRTDLYHDEYFNELLNLEMRRCERSKEPILLMLTDLSMISDSSERYELAKSIMEALSAITRDTDIKGWHVEGSVIGAIFTEVALFESGFASKARHIIKKCSDKLSLLISSDTFSKIAISWQIYPEELSKIIGDSSSNAELFSLVSPMLKSKNPTGFLVKRVIDICGSFAAIVFFAPLIGGISFLIKMTSKGPILFKQERIGMGGRKFKVLKFRSMHVNNDASIHKEFVKSLIAGGKNPGGEECQVGSNGTYKIQNDPRVTSIGRLLRKTSLDELPQFFNVLKGDMSLVGPRPPIEYECEDYDVWHRHRVLDMKPGITGLWQVTGRSSTSFDDMVRLDIKYIREWSIWLDIRIILKTPFVVVSGSGAY